MQLSNKIAVIGAIIGFISFVVATDLAFAGGGLVDNSITTTNPTPTTTDNNSLSQIPTGGIIPSSSTPSTLNSSVGQLNQQSGGFQSNVYAPTLTTPTCNGGCFFAVTKASPTTSGSGTNLEAVVGVNISFGSNDGGAAERERLKVEMEKYRSEHDIRLALSEKLAEALENGKTERAIIIAMNLAPMLGYKDYQLLLKAVSSSKSTHPQMENR
jgi:hypothetical protein